MGKRVLLIEPYDHLANIIGLCLEDLGYEFDLATNGATGGRRLSEGTYDCVLINIDQNSDEWEDQGIYLGKRASSRHIPVVMIADHKIDAATATAKGCTVVRKPFTLDKLKTAISRALAAA
jgi:DNA-binding NtrC family response regulator